MLSQINKQSYRVYAVPDNGYVTHRVTVYGQLGSKQFKDIFALATVEVYVKKYLAQNSNNIARRVAGLWFFKQYLPSIGVKDINNLPYPFYPMEVENIMIDESGSQATHIWVFIEIEKTEESDENGTS